MSERDSRSDHIPALPNSTERQSSAELLAVVYEELRKLAAAKMAQEAPGQTLQPTALVHEAWMRLGGNANEGFQNQAHFFAAAAEAMRRILIDRARRKHAERHGGKLERVDIADIDLGSADMDDQLLAVNEALDLFETLHPRAAQLMKLRYFAGMTIKEAAMVLDISTDTAKDDAAFARAWLFDRLSKS